MNGAPPIGKLPPGMVAKPNLALLLRALKRRWLLGTFLGVFAAAAAGLAAWYFVPPKFTARALIFIGGKQTSIMESDKGLDMYGTFQKTQAGRIKSHTILNRALEQPKVSELGIIKNEPHVLEWLDKELIVDFSISNEIAKLTLTGGNPQELKTLLNAIIDAYVADVSDQEDRARQERLQKLKDVYTGYEDTRRNKLKAYRDLSQSLGSGNPAVVAFRQTYQQEVLASRRKDLIDLQRKVLEARLELQQETKKKQLATDPVISQALIDARLESDGSATAEKALLVQLRTQRETYLKAFQGKEGARLKSIDAQIQSTEQVINSLRDNNRPRIMEALKAQARAEQADRLVHAEEKYSLLKEAYAAIEQEVRKLEDQARLESGKALDAEAIKDELDAATAIGKKLKEIVDVAGIETNAPRRIYIMEHAHPLTKAAGQRQLMLAGGAGAGALGLVLLLIAYFEFMTRRINTSEDVTHGLGWRVVGALPALPNRARGGFLRKDGQDKYWHSILTESVDATRTMLLHAARTEGLRTVMVTSAVAGEGKTSLSCHLATSLARAGRRTLLIDCDLRSPAAHRLFELPCQPGFSELLRGEVDLNQVVQATPAENLWLIPAGIVDPQTLQALAHEGVPPVFEQLKQQFDFIVVDSSPVLPVVDALVIGQHVDVVIFSLLRDVSRIPNVYSAYQRLATLGIRMLGAVVNGVSKDAYGYAYKYYTKQPK